MQQWYALYTKPHREHQVQAYLDDRHVETFYPIIPAPHRKGRPTVRAFFPCYLFTHVDLAQIGLWTLHFAPGMRGVVMFGGIPAPVDERFIAELQERLMRADVVDTYGQVLEAGDPVLITSGPLAQIEAVFDRRLSPAGRVRVLVQLLKRWTKVELDSDALRKIGGVSCRDLASLSL